MIGKTIQGYRVDALLGEGGMGKVYLATDLALERKVAIKNLNANLVYDSTFLERFTNEARILSRLSHPNIALLYNYIQLDNDHYMVMEYVEGDNMDAYVRRQGALAPNLLVPILVALLDGLEYAHQKGVLHRDIKPANLMLTPYGTAKIMDFGIARISDQANRLTKVKSVVGTLEYLAPELIQGAEPSPASDCYALGVVAYELATGGVLPFKGTSEFSLMQAIIEGKVLPVDRLNRTVPKKLAGIISKAMAVHPSSRFANTAQFRAALVRGFPEYRAIDLPSTRVSPPSTVVVPTGPMMAPPETTVLEPMNIGAQLASAENATNGSGRRPYLIYALGGVAALLVVVALALLFRSGETDDAGMHAQTAEGMPAGDATSRHLLTQVGGEHLETVAVSPADVQGLVAAAGSNSQQSGGDGVPLVGPDADAKPETGTVTGTITERAPGKAPDKAPENTGGQKPINTTEEIPEAAISPGPADERPSEPSHIPASMVLEETVRVNLRLRDRLDEAKLERGTVLSFSVTDPVIYGGHTIIPKGALATAEIRKVTSKQLSIRFNTVKSVNGRDIPFAKSELSGKIGDMLASPYFMVLLERGISVP